MAARDNLHSRVVRWLKVILPLAALALLSTLFLVARGGIKAVDLPFSQRVLERMATEQRIDNPDFASVTKEGRRIEVKAASARPRPEDHQVVDARELTGVIETGQDGSIDVTSAEGTVFVADSRAILRGNVIVVTSTGYTVRTEELETALDRTELETAGKVQAEGPLGTIEAGRMAVTPKGEAPDDVTVVFKDGVKLIYVPQNQ